MIENWRRTDTVFRQLSVHCTLYAIDIRNMLVVQLSFYKAHLTRAGIHLDRDSVTEAVKGWLESVKRKIGNYEYKPDVITPCE
ncbi:hypothetical protein FGIG_01099 [Fasciola gigantica]|uniref:Uncharacterized protein n=1 Tax=Fasciola gigantica TaxID=46835 RepID=A0A504Y7Q4_FASGI|nr:hypothetical protein FGIG_01099 [Fasciola gigantica]